MDASILQSIWTVIAFVFFVGVVIWAWSSRRKSDFEEHARMALDDDISVNEKKQADPGK